MKFVRDDSARNYLSNITLADIFNVSVLGFALTRLWAYVMFFSTVIHFSTRNDISHLNSTDTWSSLGLAIALLVCALASKKFHTFARKPWASIAATLLLVIATGLLSLVESDWFRQPWCSIISALSGVGLAFFYLSWGRVYSRMNPTQAAVGSLAAFLFAALLFPAVISIPRECAVALTMALPLASGIMLVKNLKAWSEPSLLGTFNLKKSSFFVKALFSAGLLGFVESLMRGLFLEVNPVGDATFYPWVFLAATIVSAVVMCVTLFSNRMPDYGFAYKVVLFALAFIFLLMPIMPSGSFADNVLALAGYCTASLLVWVLLARTTRRYHLSSVVVFGFGWGTMVAGVLAGTFLSGVLTSFFDLSIQGSSLVALLCVCALFFVYLFLFNENSVVKLTDESEADANHTRPFKRRCEDVAATYSISAKETEVMMLVAKGRSTPRICEELDISQSTVNTHLTHIYRKLDIHDKQQLIDILEGRPRV